MANNFRHVNGSLRKKKPTSNTRRVDVPPITNDEVTRRPLAYASSVNRLTHAVATPTATSEYALVIEKLIGAPVARIDSVRTTLMRKATPVMIAVPSAGWVPDAPSLAATM